MKAKSLYEMIFLITLVAFSYQLPYREYKFANQALNTATVSDTGNEAQKYNLVFTPGDFYFYSDYRGVQFSGQYVKSDQVATSYFIPSTQFYLQMFFYVCDVNEFEIFCLQQLSSIGANVPYLCIHSDENGQLFIDMRLHKAAYTGSGSNYYPSTGATGIMLKQGWNWIGIKVWTLWGFSYVTYYQSDESQTTASTNKQTSVSYVWEGTFDQSQWNAAELIIGCRMRDRTNLHVYGNCMRGYINYIKISPLADYAYKDEAIFSATHKCTSLSGCNFCAVEYQNTCWEQINTFSNQIIEEWDTLSLITYPSILKAKVSSLRNLAKNTDRTNWPTQIGGQGLLFGSDVWSYIMKDDNSATYYFAFPPRFTIEAWIKLDLNYTMPDTSLMTIFGKFTGSNPASLTSANRQMKVGFAVANRYLRVYVNSLYYDIDYEFVENFKWQHISVEYDLLFAYQTTNNYKSTQITVWVDGVKQITKQLDDAVNYVFSGYLILGDGFQGLIRKVRVLNRTPCITQQPESLSYITAACTNSIGDSSTLCDTTDKYFGDCDNVTHYYDPTWGCKSCHKSCHTCLNDSDNGCYTCNTIGHFLFNQTSKPTTYSVTQSCMCANGTYYDSELQQCITCKTGCLVCSDNSSSCSTCSDGYYKQFDGTCQKTCPPGYVGNDEFRICQIDVGKQVLKEQRGYLLRDYIEEQVHVDIEERQGCLFGEYWSNQIQQCLTCDDTCVGCQFIDGRAKCLSCVYPRFIDGLDGCSYCKPKGLGMYTDSTGQCFEYCGDGRRYHTDVCDDGNTGGGDGCNSKCQVEPNYYCRFGYFGQKDECFWQTTTIKNYTVTNNNDIILEFTRPIQALNGSISDNDFEITLISREKQQTIVNWTLVNTELPSSFLYLYLNIKQTVQSSSYYDNMIVIKYKNTGNILDTYNQFGNQVNIPKRQLQSENASNDPENKFHEIQQDLTIKAFLTPKTYFSSYYKDQTEIYGKIILYLIAGSIALQLTIGFMLNKSIMPVFIILLTWQQIFLTSVNDVFWNEKARYFFSYLRFFQFEFQLLSPQDISNLLDISNIQKQEQNRLTMTDVYQKNLYLNGGYQYNSMLMNANSKIIILIAITIIVIVCSGLEQGLQMFTDWRNIYLSRIVKRFYWTLPITFVLLFFYPLLLTTILEINKKEYETNWDQKLSFSLAMLSCFCLATFFIVIWLIICVNTKNKKLKLVKRKFEILMKAFKKGGINTHYWPIQMLKLLLLAFLQSIVQEFATGPLAIQIITVGGVGLYIAVVRPFKSLLDNLLAIIGEFTIIAVQMVSLQFISPGDVSDKENYGKIDNISQTFFFLADYIQYICVASSTIQMLLMVGYHLKSLHDYFYRQEHGLQKAHDPTFRFIFKNRKTNTDKYDNYFYHSQQEQRNIMQGYRFDNLGMEPVNKHDSSYLKTKNSDVDISFNTNKQKSKKNVASNKTDLDKKKPKKVKKHIIDHLENININPKNQMIEPNLSPDLKYNDVYNPTDEDNFFNGRGRIDQFDSHLENTKDRLILNDIYDEEFKEEAHNINSNKEQFNGNADSSNNFFNRILNNTADDNNNSSQDKYRHPQEYNQDIFL
eukprot:403338812